jgi:TonB family protein
MQSSLISSRALSVIAALATISSIPVSDSNAQRQATPVKSDSAAVYFEYQVADPVTLIKWTTPSYPTALKSAKVEGEVILQFIVGLDGRIEAKSERVLKATNPAFSSAVMATLESARYEPATRNEKAVRQLVQQSFLFRI